MTKKPRVYKPRLVGGKVMMPADLERLHKYMLEIEGIEFRRVAGIELRGRLSSIVRITGSDKTRPISGLRDHPS